MECCRLESDTISSPKLWLLKQTERTMGHTCLSFFVFSISSGFLTCLSFMLFLVFHQLIQTLFLHPVCLIFSLSNSGPGHVPSNRCLPLVPICMLPCCRCHFLALYPCEKGERWQERERERETDYGGKCEGQRRKARKQGNACRCRAYLVYKYANTVAFVICKWEITDR